MAEVYSSEQIAKPPIEPGVAKRSYHIDPQERKAMIDRILGDMGEAPGQFCHGAFVVRPNKRFWQKQDDEEVVLLLREHPVTNVRWVLGALVFLIVPHVVLFTGLLEWLPGHVIFLGQLILYLLVFGFVFHNFLRWYYSVLIITNERVVDIDYVALFNLHKTHADLDKIEEKSLSQVGLLQSYFRFGNVDIATAAGTQNVEIANVPFPDKVLRILDELTEEFVKRRERGE